MWELVSEMNAAISAIADYNTVNIGVETGLGAKDCPLARIDPETRGAKNKYFYAGRIQVLILVDAKNNLPGAYQKLFDLEAQTIAALRSVESLEIEPDTQYDLNSVQNFKSCILSYDFSFKNGTDGSICK